jgi:hypothetical protein
MPELDAAALIAKHRAKGVLVDSNLLVLYLVGQVNQRRILNFKRTQNFTVEDFELLTRLMAWFGKLIATPHVLAQVSDLSDLPGKDLRRIRQLFRFAIEKIEEIYDSGRVLAANPIFERLGLTDAAIATVCSRGILVLTADVRLQLALQHRGADALNFNHVRQLAWN